MNAFRIAFMATLGYAFATLVTVAALFTVASYGWPLLEREVGRRYEASHVLWCADHSSELSCR